MIFKIRKRWLDETSSTNDYACELVKQGEEKEGFLVASIYQSKGKGVGENTWESEPGMNLTFSLILEPRFISPGDQFLLNECISIAVAGFVNELAGQLREIRIKWPNDVYAGEDKIAGILINNIIQGNEFKYSIVGIGININQQNFYSNAPNPISIRQITAHTYPIESCLEKIIDYLEKEYNGLISGNTADINERYKALLYRIGVMSDFMADGKQFRGCIKGVSPFGQLIIEENKGLVRVFDFKQLVFINKGKKK